MSHTNLNHVKNQIKFGLSENPKLQNILLKSIDEKSADRLMEYRLNDIFPKSPFAAFKLVPEDIKVVILGQDPYYTKGYCNFQKKQVPYAIGVAFGVPNSIKKLPPSLVNILKESNSNTKDYSLTSWAKQGVLLLNTALTVKEGNPNIYAKDYEIFTRSLLKEISTEYEGVIFLLWGNNAKSYLPYINKNTSYVLQAAHPSPLSAHNGFFGCNHFNEVNNILKSMGKEKINW